MKQKLYDLKIKVLKSKIKANEKLEMVEQIFQIETDLTINYTRCCTELKDKEVRTFEDFLRLFCEETGKQKWIYNDSVWSLDYLFYKYRELYKNL